LGPVRGGNLEGREHKRERKENGGRSRETWETGAEIGNKKARDGR